MKEKDGSRASELSRLGARRDLAAWLKIEPRHFTFPTVAVPPRVQIPIAPGLAQQVAIVGQQWEATIAPAFRQIQAAVQQWTTDMAKVQAVVDETAAMWTNTLQRMSAFFEELGDPTDIPLAWYPEMPLGLLLELKRHRAKGLAELESKIVAILSPHVDEMKSEILDGDLSVYRRQAIDEAFDAYHQGLYSAATYAFITQAEGFVRDAVCAIEGTDEKANGWFLKRHELFNVLQKHGIMGHERKPLDKQEFLNRNNILHGRDLGTTVSQAVALQAMALAYTARSYLDGARQMSPDPND